MSAATSGQEPRHPRGPAQDQTALEVDPDKPLDPPDEPPAEAPSTVRSDDPLDPPGGLPEDADG